MNMLKSLFGHSKENKGCCGIQIVEVKEAETTLDENKKADKECCSPTSNRECC